MTVDNLTICRFALYGQAMTTDPTLQTSGGLVLTCKNLTNELGGVQLMPHAPEYGPPSAPPPEWAAGTQYVATSSTTAEFGSVVSPAGYSSYLEGLGVPLQIVDMSTQQVVPGKFYYLKVDCFGAKGNAVYLRLYAAISGSAAGSTVLPGFGLYNLSSAPGAWAYITPAVFDGYEFSISVNNPYFAEPLDLTVRYQPLRFLNWFSNASRLSYSVSGGTWSSYPNAGTPEHEPAVSDILRASHEYEVVAEGAAG
jgi:hypothetical protein